MRIALVILSIAIALAAPVPVDAQNRVLRIAVVNTPDILLESLIPLFERGTGYRVTMQVTESVFDLARAGQVDLVIAHYGHQATEAFMADGLGRWPKMVFANQAVMVGPSADPAGIRGLSDGAEAMRRIAQRGGEFLVNNAPTERYLADVLWRAAGSPSKSAWQLDLQLRDQAAIEAAESRGAYTLWGLVPFLRLQQQRQLQQRPLGMSALITDEVLFQRVMLSIVVNPSRVNGIDEQGARGFERFLLDPSTQALIRSFRHDGLTVQTWWPAGRNNPGTELGF
jgi:tungstate transport system substrate-binding protein